MTGIETKEDITDGSSFGDWKLWSQEIENAKKFREPWDKEVKEYYDIYKNDTKGAAFTTNRYPIMWANIQTLKPLIFSNLPLAEIRRRYIGKDAVARLSSILLERSVNFFLEAGNAAAGIAKTRDDGLITGLGEIKVRYEAEISKLESGSEAVTGKKIEYDFVSWDDYLTSPAKDETLIRWKAYKHKRTREQLVEQFGKEKGDKVALNETILEGDDIKDEDDTQTFKRAEVWEIWDKTEGKVIFWSNGYKEGVLSSEDDVYNLVNFFPSPRSLNLGRVNGSILPVPPYRMYKAQAVELNVLADRIETVTKAIKAGGLYNQVMNGNDVDSLLNNEDDTYSPVQVPPEVDINKMIYTRDIVGLANVLTVLRSQKAELIEEIKDITGISDIVRGNTKASETATAQKLKSNFAISRIQTQQQAMSEFIKDMVEITGELLAENWSGEELAEIAGITVTSQKEFDEKIANMAAGLDVNEQEFNKIIKTMREEQERTIKTEGGVTDRDLKKVEKLLRNDKMRGYAIDVETETTAQVDSDKLKAQRIEFMNTMTAFLTQNTPLVQAGLLPMEAFKAMIGFVARPFKVGRELEESFELIGEKTDEQKEAEKQPTAEMIDAQQNKRKIDIDEENAKTSRMKVEGELKLDAAKMDHTSMEKENDRESDFTLQQLKDLRNDAKQQGVN